MSFPTPSFLEQGRQALAQQNLPLAIQLLGRAVAANPNDAGAMALLGMAYSQAGQHAQAQQYLQGAAQRQPQNAGFRYQLGLMLERAGDPVGAAQAYQEALRINPSFVDAQGRLQSLRRQQAPAPSQPLLRPSTPPASISPVAKVQVTPGSLPHATPAGAYFHQPAPGYTPTVRTPEVPDMDVFEALMRRFAAVLIDGIIVSIVVWGVVILGTGGVVLGSRAAPDSPVLNLFGGMGVLFLWYVFPMLATITYMVWMDSTRGQTLGKMTMGIRIVSADGRCPSVGQALLRDSVGRWVSSLFCAVGYFWMLWDPAQQTWADKIASTYVRRA